MPPEAAAPGPAFPPDSPTALTHLDASGAVRMVEVGDRPPTAREAVAEGFLSMAAATLALVREGKTAKGDVLAVARVAAIQAAKRTADLIPLCHPLPLTGVDVRIEAASASGGQEPALRIEVGARTTASTGVEMEALTAVQVGLLTLYDMLKATDPAMTIGPVRLLRKSGGRHGDWQRPEPAVAPGADPASRAAAGRDVEQVGGCEPYGPEGLPLEQARARILAELQPLQQVETLTLAKALGRVTLEPVLAADAVPGFRASIMDGYAVAGDAMPEPGRVWRLVGRSVAGAPYRGRTAFTDAEPGGLPLAEGEAVRILTGAVVPEGCSRVLPQELVKVEGEKVTLVTAGTANPWIRGPEEEASVGQVLVPAGQRLSVADLGRLASCGLATVRVRRRPRIGLLISGDELLPPGAPRGPGQIWESNGTLLAALLERLGYEVAERRVVADRPEPLREALAGLAADCDLVVSTGGVAAGDSDWIRPLVAELGEVRFWKLFLKPGRPFAWGQVAGRPFFGLPGNPVAAAITALQLLAPALQRLEGSEPQPPPRLRVRLEGPLRRGAGRPELARARLVVAADGALLARVEGSQASSRVGSLQGADLLLEIPAELGTLEAGTPLWAQLLRLPLF